MRLKSLTTLGLVFFAVSAFAQGVPAAAQNNSSTKEKYANNDFTTLKGFTTQQLIGEAEAACAGNVGTYSSYKYGIDTPKANLYRVAQANNIYEPFGWILNAAETFGDAGNGAVLAAQTSLQTETNGKITWETEHYASNCSDTQHHPDFSVGGNLGIIPTLVLVNLTNQGVAVPPNVRPMLQDAFGWDITPRVNFPLWQKAEVSGFATLGQTLLTTDVTSFKQGDNTIVATRISNETGRSAIVSEYGVQMRLFSQASLFQTHFEKSYIIPAASLSAGLRRDTRFKPAGDIKDYLHPEQRYFFRFFISLNKSMQKKQVGDTSAPFSVNFSVDYDAPRSDSRVPAATRFTISSDVDIMKLFHPTIP